MVSVASPGQLLNHIQQSAQYEMQRSDCPCYSFMVASGFMRKMVGFNCLLLWNCLHSPYQNCLISHCQFLLLLQSRIMTQYSHWWPNQNANHWHQINRIYVLKTRHTEHSENSIIYKALLSHGQVIFPLRQDPSRYFQSGT